MSINSIHSILMEPAYLKKEIHKNKITNLNILLTPYYQKKNECINE
jgi:hypothetical protein